MSKSVSGNVALAVLFAALTACAGGGEGEGEGEGDGTEGEGEGEPACVAAVAGGWDGNGSCYGMLMTNTTTVDGCALTFSGWNMLMSVPAGATIAGNAVTFTGAGWTDCTGTITEDGTRITGGCSDGCSLTMEVD